MVEQADGTIHLSVEDLARVCHEANRAYCQSIGDNEKPPWRDAPHWMQQAARFGVTAFLGGALTSAEDCHEAWFQEKKADGWCYGEEIDYGALTHPCMVPYEKLPEKHRVKDDLFLAILNALGPHVVSVNTLPSSATYPNEEIQAE